MQEYQCWCCSPPSLSICVSTPSAASGAAGAVDSAANDPAVARQQAQDKNYLLQNEYNFSVLQEKLPKGVICQFAPVDTPPAVDAFLRHWHPDAAIFMESELWPNLLLAASRSGMVLALLNARMSIKSFRRWSTVPARPLIATMLSRFSLIAPQNTNEAVHFQLLGAAPSVINFSGNLKYASGTVNKSIDINLAMEELAVELSDREVWMASSTHKGEENVMSWIHKQLKMTHPSVLTIIVPRHPQRGHEITQ
ncbi:hypothetical protein KI387_016461, partial [Taxus chinensis]